MSLPTISELYKKDTELFLAHLLRGDVTISEILPGEFFAVQFVNSEPKYFNKRGELSYAERSVNNYYEQAIAIFDNIPIDVRYNIPFYLKFCFKYSPSSDNTSITSENILRLTHIKDTRTEATISDIAISEWVNFFKVGNPPILFSGTLTDEQKTSILDFVYSNPEELSTKFKSVSFTRHILSVLNSDYDAENIDGIVFNFNSNGGKYTAKLIDPLFYDTIMQNPVPKQEFDNGDMARLLIIKMMTFIETYRIEDLKKVVVPNLTFDQNYVRLMNTVYVDFIKANYCDLLKTNLTAPSHVKHEVNVALIDNEDAVKAIMLSTTFKEVYRIMVSAFKKKKRDTALLFNENLLKQFNNVVVKIFNIISEASILNESCLSNFENEFESIAEAINWQNSEIFKTQVKKHRDRESVNLIIDNFQPISNLHINIAELLKRRNKLNTVLIIYNKHTTIPVQVIKEMVDKIIATKTTDIIDYVIVNDNSIKTILSEITGKYNPIILAASESLIEDYELKLDYAKKHNILYNISKKFQPFKVPELSNPKFIEYFKSNNLNAYKANMPQCLHPMFFELLQFYK